MEAFKTTLVTSIAAAFLISSTFAAPVFDLGARPLKPDSVFKSSNARLSDVKMPLARVDRAVGEPEAPAWYSPLGIAKINGQRIAVYGFQNGAKLDDAAGQGRGSAEVFDSAGHLKRRFIYRENLNSPPKIAEFIYLPPH